MVGRRLPARVRTSKKSPPTKSRPSKRRPEARRSARNWRATSATPATTPETNTRSRQKDRGVVATASVTTRFIRGLQRTTQAHAPAFDSRKGRQSNAEERTSTRQKDSRWPDARNRDRGIAAGTTVFVSTPGRIGNSFAQCG